MNGKIKSGIFSIAAVTILLLILIAINLLISLLPSGARRIDLTNLGLSELSEESVKYIDSLKLDITLAHICVAGEEDVIVTDLLEKYGEASPNIKVKRVDPAVEPTFVSTYTDRTLENNSVIVISGKRSKAVDYNDMFTFSLYYTDSSGNTLPQGEMSYSDFTSFFEYYSSYFGTYYSYDTLFAGESAITSAIDYTASDGLPVIYGLTGHGESPLPDTLIDDLYHDNVDVRELSIAYTGIPVDAGCIVINAPASDISEAEAKRLDDFIEAGGNILLMSEPEGLTLERLFSVISKYGMSAVPGYACESSRFIGQSYMVIADGSVASEILGIEGYSAIVPLSHAIEKCEKTTERTVAYFNLFTTSENGYMIDEFEDGDSTDREEPTYGKYTLGMLATIDSDRGAGHIAWIGTPGFVSEEINRYSTGGNYVYFLSLVENMTSKGSSLALYSKKMVEDSLMMSAGQTYFWTVTVCVVIPLTVFITGMLIIRKRKKK